MKLEIYEFTQLELRLSFVAEAQYKVTEKKMDWYAFIAVLRRPHGSAAGLCAQRSR